MTRRPARTRPTRWHRFVLWLLVAAVPWHVAVASAMALAVAPVDAAAAAVAVSVSVAAAPCHEAGDASAARHSGANAAHAGAGCAACAACCALAAPPMAIAGVEPAEAVGDRVVCDVQPAIVFLTDGPLRPPRSPRR